jgi:F-type H+-transporting ATPase subunit delta
MSEVKVASRYAKSLIDLAQEQNVLKSVRSDIEQFIDTCRVNPKLRAVLKNPIIGSEKKVSILETIFADRLDALILSFFKIVVMKGRASILYVTAKEFINEYNHRKNIVKAVITSAIALNGDNQKKVKHTVTEATKGEVILIEKVDPKLIGGFILKVGDKQIDTSIASQIQKLKKKFAQKAVVA